MWYQINPYRSISGYTDSTLYDLASYSSASTTQTKSVAMAGSHLVLFINTGSVTTVASINMWGFSAANSLLYCGGSIFAVTLLLLYLAFH